MHRDGLAVYSPWWRRERPSAGHCSPGRRRRSGSPDSWRGGAASWGTSSRPEPLTTTAAGRRLTAETQWCPPSTRYGLEDGEEGRWSDGKKESLHKKITYFKVSKIYNLKGFQIKSETAINCPWKSFMFYRTETKMNHFFYYGKHDGGGWCQSLKMDQTFFS